MKLVIDSNLLFSASITPAGSIAEIILNPTYDLEKLSAHYLVIELFKYKDKMQRLSGLGESDFLEVLYTLIKSVTFINEQQISLLNWEEARKLVADIDPKDDVHVALTLETNAVLWTGAKKLVNGLRAKGFERVITTQELLALLRDFDRTL